MRPMGGAEGVVHVHVPEGRETARKLRVVFLFFGMKTHVLQKHNVPGLHRLHGG